MSPQNPRRNKKGSSKGSSRQEERGVDLAMAGDRPAKQAIRTLWLEQAQYFDSQFPEDDVPLYLTLSGAEARDIRLLAQHNLVKLTEIGGIATESQGRVIAIEANQMAVLELQRQLPGLKILEQNFKNIILGDSLTRFPVSEQEKFCCAKIVNLDFQDPLHATDSKGGVVFPVLNWIRKISILHATKKPGLEWCLCLTLNGSLTWRQANETLDWSRPVGRVMHEFLKENFQRSRDFASSCQSLLGDALYGRLCSNELLDLGILTQEEQQKLLMVFVPKKIAQLVHDQNWQVTTTWNLRYGGRQNQAPMVTWIFSFVWDTRAASTPEAVYIDCLNKICASAGYIEDGGRIETVSSS